MAKQFQKSALMIAVLTCFTHQVAAADILTEQSFKSGSTLEVTSPIDSVLLYKKNVNKDDQFTQLRRKASSFRAEIKAAQF